MKVAVLIDGGHLRVLAKRAGLTYQPDFVESVAHACLEKGESLLRVLYYDCAPYSGEVKLPVSGEKFEYSGSDGWLRQLARKDLFAVRRGTLKFRGFKPKNVPLDGRELIDKDFRPDFEQKGVDMRIGLDIATFSANRSVDRIILLTNDTDCIPAMKHGRKAGLQIILVKFPDRSIATELLWHADYTRDVAWPDSSISD